MHTLQSPHGDKQLRFLPHNAQDASDPQAVEVQTWESFPKRPEQFCFSTRHFHFRSNARNLWASLIREGWTIPA
jgi:hypothetical protein